MLKPKVIENKKNLLKLEFEHIDQAFLSLVKEKLWKDKATQLAGFRVTHPEQGILEFTLQTKGKAAKSVWNSALDLIAKNSAEFGKQVKSLK